LKFDAFLNHGRLSIANTESRPFQIKDGDILQLGVDYPREEQRIFTKVLRSSLRGEWQVYAKYVPFDSPFF